MGPGEWNAVAGFAGGLLALSYQPPQAPGRAVMQLVASCLMAWLAAPTVLRYVRLLDGSIEAMLVAGLLGGGAQFIVPASLEALRIACAEPMRALRALHEFLRALRKLFRQGGDA